MTTALRARKIARVDVLLEPRLRTIPELLERRANELGEQPLLSVNGMSVDYRTMRDLAAGYAGRLAASGVRHGDRVAVLAENCFELLALWAGCAWLGAILVPINTASRGAQLEHVLANAAPKVLAAEANLLEHVVALEHVPEEIERLWIIGERGLRVHGLSPESFPETGTHLT